MQDTMGHSQADMTAGLCSDKQWAHRLISVPPPTAQLHTAERFTPVTLEKLSEQDGRGRTPSMKQLPEPNEWQIFQSQMTNVGQKPYEIKCKSLDQRA